MFRFQYNIFTAVEYFELGSKVCDKTTKIAMTDILNDSFL